MNKSDTLLYHKEAQKRWEEKHAAYCIDCGKRISSYGAIRCKSCRMKDWMRQRNTQGENSPSWKGGKREMSGGYIAIYCPEHPRANSHKCVMEHILVWEETHGKPLPEGWEVHHLNGIRNDNRPNNLKGLPKGKHHYALLMQAKDKRIQEVEALLNGQGQLL